MCLTIYMHEIQLLVVITECVQRNFEKLGVVCWGTRLMSMDSCHKLPNICIETITTKVCALLPMDITIIPNRRISAPGGQMCNIQLILGGGVGVGEGRGSVWVE